jgi:putative transposase
MVAAAIRTIFAQPDVEHVREQLDVIATMLSQLILKLEEILREAADDLTAFADFPFAHWKNIWSPTRSSELTQRSNAASTSSASFTTPKRCTASPAAS